QPIIHKNLT
uniref:Phosphoenolpyruvate carboxykinase n=1 Tax=Trypanosoma brucei TaxID=5691 RepID=Q7M3S5_9TRYP